MAPGSPVKRDNTCDRRISRMFWAAMMSWINVRIECVSCAVTLLTITLVEGSVGHCKVKAGLRFITGLLHTYTIIITVQIDYGFFSENDLIPFRSDITPNGSDSEWVSMLVHIMGTVIATILQPGALRWYGLTQIPVLKVLPVYGWQTMRQLALCVSVSNDMKVFSTIVLSRVS
ncbi:hypothetical protein TNCV_2979031 [Trichonephila clavipes]|nr:hypothetical protein TNCV_2979031 [Trichonephila clavipes]